MSAYPLAFAPIAIVGRACVLPGALSPQALWEAVCEGRDLLSSAPAGRWRLGAEHAMCAAHAAKPDRTWSDRGGYVDGFDAIWNPDGFAVPASELDGLDPLVHWLLHCAREALVETAGRAGARPGLHPGYAEQRQRVGAVFGNLGFPSEQMAAFADQVWRNEVGAPSRRDALAPAPVDPRNRHMSGGTAEILARALQLDAGSHALDAACASSLYAIKLACDRLQEGSADLMLAGAMQRADDLFLHVGFSALNALSRSGQSRPFHRDADGLVPAEGCAMLALKRLDDARRDGDTIHAVVRGIGLSNDGRGKGMLVPDAAGQQRAMRAAYASAAIDPRAVSLLECHATGTPVGDATELRSTAAVFEQVDEIAVGSLKSNLGHLITVAGAAGLIKLIEAMRAGIRPPSLHADVPTPALADTPFRVLHAAEPWIAATPRIAAISAFGFGGNNAHLIVSEDDASLSSTVAEASSESYAITAIGCVAGNTNNRQQFSDALFSARSLRNDAGVGSIDAVTLDLAGLRFPPRDIEQALPQQLLMLHAAREALHEAGPLSRDRSAVLIGMEPDAEVARYGTRWRLAETEADPHRRHAAQAGVIAALESAGVIGCMPNIPANRLSAQFDLAGPAFTVQAGAASGLHALQIACRALARGEIDAALVGAVDLCCEPVTRAAGNTDPADAAVAMVVKRLSDAERDGDRIYAVIAKDDTKFDEVPFGLSPSKTVTSNSQTAALPQRPSTGSGRTVVVEDAIDRISADLQARLGHAGAADGLLHLAAAALSLHHRRQVGGVPWLSAQGRVVQAPLSGSTPFVLREAVGHARRSETAMPRLHVYSGADKAAVIAALNADQTSDVGPARLVLVATDDELPTLRERALAHLQTGVPAGQAIHYRDAPLPGQIAFAFAGAGAAYPGMGRDLCVQLPQLLNTLAERSSELATALEWAYDGRVGEPSVQQQLWGASALSQLHVELSEDVLGLHADAWLGYSSGETNALVASGVWNDPDALMDEMAASGLVAHKLGGEFSAIEAQWQCPVQWASWTVLAPIDEVRAALATVKHVHLAIINGDADCLIAGAARGCEQVVDLLGRPRCLQLFYPLAVHVPELSAVEDAWLQLHRRETSPARHGRIYSNALGRSYAPDRDACARAILDQADRTLDLRPVVLQAWDDGVRIFVEHGPGGTFARAIRGILGERDALVVSLDRKGQGIEATLSAIAALVAAGVPVQYASLERLLVPAAQMPAAQRPLGFPAHWPAVDLSAMATAIAPRFAPTEDAVHELALQPMPPAPVLPSTCMMPAANTAIDAVVRAQVEVAVSAPRMRSGNAPPPAAQRAQLAHTARVHQQFLDLQSGAHQQFLALRGQAQAMLFAASHGETAAAASSPRCMGRGQEVASPATESALRTHPIRNPTPIEGEGLKTPTGPSFTREQLLIHADGAISTIFGDRFKPQDQYLRQVRMPKPPLLLADRVLGIEGVAGSMGRGRIWTATDVGGQDWYLHQDYMPPGVMIEAGQADLMLISWLGVDAHNRGERVYRLLGCELTYHGELPRRGDTLEFEITLDGHAAQGDVRLMFFHYDCMNGARKQLSVRKGQAGFFTEAELAESAGCLWAPEQQQIVATPQLDALVATCTRTALDRAELDAFAAGNAYACFGPGFEFAQTHTRSPGIPGGAVLLLDRVTQMQVDGGPWQRGYLRAELDIDPKQWFFDGHFKNDPCMPGTLMFDTCLQAMAIHLASCGYTLKRDGWRFQPVPEVAYQLQCRGQVTPKSKLLVTEVFVEERSAGPNPTVYADLLCTVDGLKAFHARRVGLQLVPDWPLRDLDAVDVGSRVVDGFRFDSNSLIACALGRPSAAFGPMYQRFDGPTRVARLPSPPYHFISRIAEIHGPIGVMQAGARVVAEYDVPADVWYLDQNGARVMPFAVLLEAALQPCGWLSSYVGSALTVDSELGFRNLDGEGTVLAELAGGAGTLRTEVEMTAVSATAGMIIETFVVRCWLGTREVYTLRTVFGFFPPAALAAQAGLPITPLHRELLARDSNVAIDLDVAPEVFFAHPTLRLAAPMLRMIDRIEGVWPDAGAAGLGQLRAVKDVDPDEWFFKAHFFQDPVQPGSLGLEAMLQALQAFLLHQGAGRDLQQARFETIALGQTHQWKYRGQVLPHHQKVHTTLELTERGHDAHGVYAIANASLWVDGQRIYEATGLGVRIVRGDV